MRYTFSKEADKKIERDMELICKEIKKRIPGVLSIMLTGSFARGEGPVKIEKRKIFPYNDYDIQVIAKTKLNKEKEDKISTEISKKLGYKGISHFYSFKKEEQKIKKNFYIDLKFYSLKELKKMLPRIRNYELKNESKILYGKDLRYLIPNIKLEEISLSEGAKLLLDRMSQMIEYYSTEKKYEDEFLTYIIQQVYAACCTSLLLLNRKYKIGYKKSMGIFKENYKNDFSELYKKLPDLDRKIEQFIKWKINPNKRIKNIEKEWFTAKDYLLEVSKYFFSKFLNKKINSLDELSYRVLNMKKEFYLPYLRPTLNNLLGFNFGRLNSLLLPVASLILKYKYCNRLKQINSRRFSIFFEASPDMVIFSSAIFILGSVTKKGIDNQLLSKGRALLNKIYPANGKNWEEISTDYTNAYITFFLQKI